MRWFRKTDVTLSSVQVVNISGISFIGVEVMKLNQWIVSYLRIPALRMGLIALVEELGLLLTQQI